MASAAKKTDALSPNSCRAHLVRSEGENGRRTHRVRIPEARAKREREGEPRGDGGEQVPAREGGIGGNLTDRAEPVHGDGPAYLDAEHEAEKLDERARRVRDAGLQVLGRQLAHADREGHPRKERHECRQRDEVRRDAEPQLRKGVGAEAGRHRRDRHDDGLRAHDEARGDHERTHDEADEGCGDGVLCAASENRCQRSTGERVAADRERPRTTQRLRPYLLEPCERGSRLEPAVENCPPRGRRGARWRRGPPWPGGPGACSSAATGAARR